MSIILDKPFAFDIRFVKFINKQVLRCGTSIGANVNEPQAGQSKADFVFIKLLTSIVKSSEGNKYGK